MQSKCYSVQFTGQPTTDASVQCECWCSSYTPSHTRTHPYTLTHTHTLTHIHTHPHTQTQTCSPLDNIGGLNSLITLENAQKLFLKFSNFSTSGLFSDIDFSVGNGNDTLGLNASRAFFCGTAGGKGGYFETLLQRTLFGDEYQQGV